MASPPCLPSQASPALWSVGDDLVIDECDTLTTVDGFQSLTTLGGGLYLGEAYGGNDLLATVNGFGALTEVGGDLYLYDMQNLEGLAALVTIDGSITLIYNTQLGDVTALHGLEEVGGDLSIQYNYALTTEAAEALVDAIDAIGGTVTVENNGGG